MPAHLPSSLFLALLAALPTQDKPKPRAQKVPPLPADVEPVIKLSSGLKYCVLAKGPEGPRPGLGDRVKMHYTVWSTDGAVVDSSRPSTRPAEYVVGEGIDAFNEALMAMTPGSHWKLTAPPEIAYGTKGNPPVVKPNATLILELELISFEEGPELPPFHAADPSKQKKSESGLVYEPIVEGTGRSPLPDDLLQLKFAVWNPTGRLLDCSELHSLALTGRANTFPYRILQIAPQYIKVGGRTRFEASADLARGLRNFGAPYLPNDSMTVWEIELVSARTLETPAYVAPDPAKQITTASGLKYEVLKEGDGKRPAPLDNVVVIYSGWLTDGTPFDSSVYAYQLPGRVIQGWIEVVPMLKEGSIWRIEVPPNLGYAEKGRAPKIPPNATLVFQMELVQTGK